MIKSRPLDKLAAAFHSLIDNGTGTQEPSNQRRWGKVTAVNTGPPITVDITLAGNAIPGVPTLNHYVPVVGDKVCIIQEGYDLIAIGAL
jgi:hypothetical protein